MSKNLIKTIQNTAFQNSLWTKGSKIVLGVSGGPDSVCMLDVLAKLKKKYDLKLIIAHVNYGLREKESDGDEKFVRKLAEKFGLELVVLKPSFSNRKLPSENELRDIRYNFFEKIRKENGFDFVAVAHNADDQVETFLMRLIRGAGLQGLSAMKYKSGKIIRPLLEISRQEIVEHLNRTDRTYRTDKTNEENLYLRNKIRNKLIPYLEKNFNPQIKKTISASVSSIADDYDLLQKIVDKTYGTNGTHLSVKKLLQLHPALQRRMLLKLIEEKKMDLKDIESAHVEEILKVLRSKKSKRQTVIFKGLKLTRIGDKVIISRNP